MPRYYINYRNRDQTTEKVILANDDEGIEPPGLEAARAAALASAREVVADNITSVSGHPLEAVFITDENGGELLTIPAKEVLPQTLR
jgi:hypothetical protein